ncbi:MAG: DUF3427 domain-containing protein, partial [Nannocystaceae bacterium]
AKVADVAKMRGLGFCVDVAHAKFMEQQFVKAGIAAAAVFGSSSRDIRTNALRALQARELNVVFCVDLFNEGVDVPEVDTVLFLRPTESATVFLQQLGRGLRRSHGKECLTVLDFIGGANRKFRFDRRFRAILGGTHRHVLRDIQSNFPRLPSGCAIVLDRQAQKTVLDNVRYALKQGVQGLVEDLQQLVQEHGPDISLKHFVDEAGIDLEELYRGPGVCWTALRREAGISKFPPNKTIERAFSRMLHINDSARFDGLRSLVRRTSPPTANLENASQRALFVLLGHRDPFSTMQTHWQELWSQPHLLSELRQLLDYLEDHARARTYPLAARGVSRGAGSPAEIVRGGPRSQPQENPRCEAALEIPLQVHATYSLDEAMAALDERNTKGGVMRIQTGTYFSKRHQTSLHFVTLEKSEKNYTPTTLYNDYPISPRRFHWETQSSGHAGTVTGRRYIATTRDAPHQSLLFVRQTIKDERRITNPYVLLGRCFYVKHEGERPMAIEWELERPMPAWLWQETKVAAG